eukprot:15450926-Alexandrium_andersonii.AAC.1
MAEEERRDAEASDAERISALGESVLRERDGLCSEQTFVGQAQSFLGGIAGTRGDMAQQATQDSSSSSEEAAQEPGFFERARGVLRRNSGHVGGGGS